MTKLRNLKYGKLAKGLLIAAASFFGLFLVLLIVIQIVLSPKVVSRLIDKYAPEYIDGKVSTSNAYVSIFSHFPAVTANLENLEITYDGRSGSVDTLASFKRFTAAVNILSLVRGVINVKTVELLGPRLFVHYYEDGSSNLDIIKATMDSSEEDSDSLTVIPPVILRRVKVGEGVHLVYSDDRDTLKTTLRMRNLSLKGRLYSDEPLKSRFSFSLDTLALYGYMGSDSLFFNLDHLRIKDRRGDCDIDAEATAYAATSAFGRIKVPLSVNGEADLSKDSDEKWHLSLRDFKFNIATVNTRTDMDFVLGDRIYMKGRFAVPDLDLQRLSSDYVAKFFSEAARLKTDARIAFAADLDGYYDSSTGELPSFDAVLDMGRSSISHPDVPLKPEMELHVGASGAQGGPVGVKLTEMKFSADGLDLSLSGEADDVMGKAPRIQAISNLHCNLAELGDAVGDMLGMHLAGEVEAGVEGSMNAGAFNIYDPSSFDLKADATISNVSAVSYDDSLSLYLDKLGFKAGMMQDRLGINSSGEEKVFGASVKADSLSFRAGGGIDVRGKSVMALVLSSPSELKDKDGNVYHPLNAMLSLGSLHFKGEDSLAVRLKDSKNRFRITPDRKGQGRPVFSVSSDNSRLMARSGVHRVFLSGLGFNADASMSVVPQKRRPADSIFFRRYRKLDSNAFVPRNWMKEADFRKSDIKIDLGETFRKYFSEWNVKGSLKMGRGIVATPAFPLRTAVTGFHGLFSNEKITIDTLRLVSGASNLSATGTVSNLRRVLNGKGTVRFVLQAETDSLALTEMLAAYARGQQNMQTDLAYLAAMDDDTYESAVGSEPLDTAAQALIVIPANVDGNISLHGRGVHYGGLNITDLDAGIRMKQRCLQLNGLKANTTVGKLYADAFYSTASKEEIYTGFNVDLDSVAVGDVIEILPGIDTLMPLLKTFDGQVNCNLAATVRLDTLMNLILPSMEGVMRIYGKDLHFTDSKEITRLGRLLLFKNPKRATIDTMLVEGIVRDNSFEIFPFLLKMDRWTLAVAGVQNMDQSFKYHFSLAKTPLLIKLGANVYGDDFDHIKFRLGRARYRNVKSIPSFTGLIDTTRINLVSSIRNVFEKGVRKAVEDNAERRRMIDEFRRKSGYDRSAALDSLEALSSSEQVQVDSLSFAEDSLSVIPAALPQGGTTVIP